LVEAKETFKKRLVIQNPSRA